MAISRLNIICASVVALLAMGCDHNAVPPKQDNVESADDYLRGVHRPADAKGKPDAKFRPEYRPNAIPKPGDP